jgi:hypothetical protein
MQATAPSIFWISRDGFRDKPTQVFPRCSMMFRHLERRCGKNGFWTIFFLNSLSIDGGTFTAAVRAVCPNPDECRKEREMITMIFEYDIAVEKQVEYIQTTKEKIKPLWESIGCKAYDIWQVADSKTGFIKTMLFEDVSEMKKIMTKKEADHVKQLFGKFAENVSRKVCEKKT